MKQVGDSSVVADQRWGFDSAGNRTLSHDLVANVRTEFSHNNTNALIDRKVYSSSQKLWVQGGVNEPASVSLGGKPVAVKGDNTFQGQAPSRTTSITARDAAGNTTNENWQLTTGSGSTPDATTTFTHDAEGNLLGDGTSTFEWDLKNRITAINTAAHRTEFIYDGSDRRVRVVEKDGGSVTSDRRYVFHGLALLEERAADNVTVLRRFYGGGHVDVADGGKRYAYTTDHLGSVREVMLLDGASGNPTTATLAARYDYDAWGKRTVLDGGASAETLTLHGYTGHMYHKWSGLWLAPYRAYSPAFGRWISRDPIGVSGGVNLFAYVGNAPTVATDPLGLTLASNLGLLWDFVTGGGETNRTYGNPSSGSFQTTEMAYSPGGNKLRDAFYQNGGANTTLDYGTGEAFVDTILNPATAYWGSTALQVGGFQGATATNNGNGTVTFNIKNVAGANSFFYHRLPNKDESDGMFRSITQEFEWTEPIDRNRLPNEPEINASRPRPRRPSLGDPSPFDPGSNVPLRYLSDPPECEQPGCH